MNAYFFTASVAKYQIQTTDLARGQTADRLHTWDSCVSLIVCADDVNEARDRFEAWLRLSPEGENPIQTKIKKLVAAQFMSQLLTESDQEPIEWKQISQRIEPTLQCGAADEFDQGYWVEVNQLIRPGKLSPGLELLRRDLPNDIVSGLNWSADKQFFFIVSVLSPPSRSEAALDEGEVDAKHPDEDHDQVSAEFAEVESDASEASLPELADKEVAALVQARNSVVAGWLWRKFAADTQYAANDIQIEPWCGQLAVDKEPTRQDEKNEMPS